jgi:hypothetical protein
MTMLQLIRRSLSLSLKQFLAQKSITVMEHSPCSPYLAPSDFWLFSQVQSTLRGRTLQDIEDIRKHVMMVLKAFPQQEIQKGF